ncbi:radical SAM family heme chaperone HemW [Atopobium sp. oral taxon 810]|uniref:radical SAM family heme chaperone HemW n=1 Tax=Atopobium sp. oral taxon 810 TaxID=712158 RepID=UPI000397E11A|nr:radical SAM family heme chaperone HemW [Atopobium sp. oral taxon 810]ERI03817.1 putative oxygen-independent coproporphyrinogen III oxidase [Atopobium sp. oral taxon 810 str. F0209]
MSWDKRLHEDGFEAIYLHIPFCIKKCAYCDFYSLATPHHAAVMQDYLDALIADLHRAATAGLLEHSRWAYIGGGTPSMLGDGLVQLVSELRQSCPELCELSSEANPESLSAGLVSKLKEAGLTRLSVGVQSCNDKELKALGRVHDAACAELWVKEAVAAGLDVSCDLMCAIPLQTAQSWKDSLDKLISWGPTHISVYPLQIEEGTELAYRLGDENPAWNDSDVQAERMSYAADKLSSVGFERYEVASFAKNHKFCQHNLSYWQGRSYLGLGKSAAGMMTAELYGCMRVQGYALPKLEDSFKRIRTKRTGDKLELEFLTERQACAEDLMLSARLVEGISADQLDYAQSILGKARLERQIEQLIKRGLLQSKGQCVVPTQQGWLLGNELFEMLWSLAPEFETKTLEVTL